MRIVKRPLLAGLGLGIAAAASAVAVHAYMGGAMPHAAPGRPDLLSVSGTPQELAARSELLADHVCAMVEAAAACPLPPLAAVAAADLRALQGLYVEGMRDMHDVLLAPAPDAAQWKLVEGTQRELLDHASERYLRFLADASATLDAGQRQRLRALRHPDR